jgi:hypothetical protein
LGPGRGAHREIASAAQLPAADEGAVKTLAGSENDKLAAPAVRELAAVDAHEGADDRRAG